MLPVIRQRHPLFKETNAVSKPMPVPHTDLWRRCLPSQHDNPSRGNDDSFWNAARNLLSPQHPNKEQHHGHGVIINDVQVQFDNPTIGARQLLERCGVVNNSSSQNNKSSSSSLTLPETIMAEEDTIKYLATALSYFQTVAAPPNSPKNVKCIARIVSTFGSVGTKCPRWHADHIPVRLIMSILGPGCEYIPETITDDDQPRIVDRQALNNLDEDDTMKANDIIVPPHLLSDAENRFGEDTIMKHAKEGDAVLLMGRGWEDTTTNLLRDENESAAVVGESVLQSTYSDKGVLAAVHRSPTLLPDQERILLTVDLVDWN